MIVKNQGSAEFNQQQRHDTRHFTFQKQWKPLKQFCRVIVNLRKHNVGVIVDKNGDRDVNVTVSVSTDSTINSENVNFRSPRPRRHRLKSLLQFWYHHARMVQRKLRRTRSEESWRTFSSNPTSTDSLARSGEKMSMSPFAHTCADITQQEHRALRCLKRPCDIQLPSATENVWCRYFEVAETHSRNVNEEFKLDDHLDKDPEWEMDEIYISPVDLSYKSRNEIENDPCLTSPEKTRRSSRLVGVDTLPPIREEEEDAASIFEIAQDTEPDVEQYQNGDSHSTDEGHFLDQADLSMNTSSAFQCQRFQVEDGSDIRSDADNDVDRSHFLIQSPPSGRYFDQSNWMSSTNRIPLGLPMPGMDHGIYPDQLLCGCPESVFGPYLPKMCQVIECEGVLEKICSQLASLFFCGGPEVAVPQGRYDGVERHSTDLALNDMKSPCVFDYNTPFVLSRVSLE